MTCEGLPIGAQVPEFYPSFGNLFEPSSGGGHDIVIVTPGDFVKWESAIVGRESGAGFVVGSAVDSDMTIGKHGAGEYHGYYGASLQLDHNQCVIAAMFKTNAANPLGVMLPESERRLTSPQAPRVFADSITIVNGTLISGTVDSTRNRDGVFYIVQEVTGAHGLLYDIAYTDKSKTFNILEVIYEYQGSAAHKIKARAYNNDTSVYDDYTALDDDFPSYPGITVTKRFKLPGAVADYYDANGVILNQVDHVTNGTATHHFLLDETAMVGNQPFIDLAGTFDQPLVEDDKIDLRFTCPLNAKTLSLLVANAGIQRKQRP